MVEETFSKNNIIWYAIYSKFATFADSEKNQVLSKKPTFKKKFVCNWEISLFQLHSTANLVIKKIQIFLPYYKYVKKIIKFFTKNVRGRCNLCSYYFEE